MSSRMREADGGRVAGGESLHLVNLLLAKIRTDDEYLRKNLLISSEDISNVGATFQLCGESLMVGRVQYLESFGLSVEPLWGHRRENGPGMSQMSGISELCPAGRMNNSHRPPHGTDREGAQQGVSRSCPACSDGHTRGRRFRFTFPVRTAIRNRGSVWTRIRNEDTETSTGNRTSSDRAMAGRDARIWPQSQDSVPRMLHSRGIMEVMS